MFKAGIPAVLCVACVAFADEGARRQEYRYSCFLFDSHDRKPVFEGNLSFRQTATWFKEYYDVFGSRVEAPRDAKAIGALIVTDGKETIVIPMLTWGPE